MYVSACSLCRYSEQLLAAGPPYCLLAVELISAACLLFPGYAKPIVKRIDPEGKYFERVLYRDATVSANGRENIKDLKCIGQRMEKVVLVDNSPFSFMMQPNNGIPIKSFGGDAEDDELMTVTLPLLKKLAELDDIRPVLAEQFNMVHWFARKGVVLPKGVTLVKPRV